MSATNPSSTQRIRVKPEPTPETAIRSARRGVRFSGLALASFTLLTLYAVFTARWTGVIVWSAATLPCSVELIRDLRRLEAAHRWQAYELRKAGEA